MPAFGVASSMPPVSSSLSPCISTLVPSNGSSGPENSCAPVPDRGMSHLIGPSHMPAPPPSSLLDTAPYSPPPAYPPVFRFGPPSLPSARFPLPPNPSFARPISNLTFFEGTQSDYPPEPHTVYDLIRWSDRNVNSTPYGGDHLSKSFPHWPLPTFNSGIDININSNSNSNNFGFLKPDPLFPPLAPYPPVDSVTNLGPKFSPLSGFPNASGMPSTPSASITSPFASSHFGAFPPPNLPVDFPHSSGRFPLNPHASTFLPGMDPPPPSGPGVAEFMPEPIPSYLSRPGAYEPSSSFQTPDRLHDLSAPRIPSPETTRSSITSDSPSSFYGLPPRAFHSSSDYLSHKFSSRSDNGPLCSSEGTPVLDFSSGFPAPFTLPYPPPPHPGGLFTPYSSAPSLYQESPRNGGGGAFGSQRDEELTDRIVCETGKLMYQHMSPEEWRWKHYEPTFSNAFDPSGIFSRVHSSGYNHFHGVDSTEYSAFPNSTNVVTEEGSSSGASKSDTEQEDILELSKSQNQAGPSLKLAASALAEMLASGPNGASSSTSRSMLSQVEASGTGLTFDGGFHLPNSSSGGQTRTEGLLDDCCSSSGSAVGHKEGRDVSSSLGHEFGGPTAENYLSGLNVGSPTGSKREISELLEDPSCDFIGATVWTLPKPSRKIESPANVRSRGGVDSVLPQSAKGGALHSSGQRRLFSKGSTGIMRQPLVSTGATKPHGTNAQSSSKLENYNSFSTQCSNLSSKPQSGSIMPSVSSPLMGVQPSDYPTSVISPFASMVTAASGRSLFCPHQELSGGTSNHLPLDPSPKDQWHVNSTSCGTSPPLSQAYLDQQRYLSGSQPTTGAASRVLGNLKWNGPESSRQTEVNYSGSGFHSLTASISNLSKVLFLLDSSPLTPPDSAVLEETLQSSILRLSECLLLEQSRINKNLATHFVGSDRSSASRQGRADGPLPDIDVGGRVETGGSTNLGHLKASGVGILPKNVSRSGSPSHLCNANDLKAMNDVGARAGKDSRHSHYNNLKRPSSSQETGALGDGIIQRLIDTEAREASLKVLVEELREELEMERVENRGTALLCDKIMQETKISKGKAVMQGAQKADYESKEGRKEIGLTAKMKNSEESFLNRIDEVESRLALLLARPASTPHLEISNDASGRSESREDMDAVANGNSYENAVLSSRDQAESQPAPKNTSHGTSGSVESRLALLQARPTGMNDRNSHDVSNRDVDELVPHSGGIQSTSQRTSLDGVEARLALIHGRPGLDDELGVFTETEPCTPAHPAAVDLESGIGGFSELSLPDLHEEEVATKALKAMTYITSQLLTQSETLSNMHASWSQLSKQVSHSKSAEKESDSELQQREAELDILNSTSQSYDTAQARALLIRSRPDWTEDDESESETEDFLGGQVSKISLTNSVRYESDQFETMNEISLVRCLDSDVELSQPRQAIGSTSRVEASKLGNGSPTRTQDSEDDSDSWEHVLFPQRDSE